MILAWVKMVAWAELVNVGLILVGVGTYGLWRSLSAAKAAGTLSDVVRRQIEEILRESEKTMLGRDQTNEQ